MPTTDPPAGNWSAALAIRRERLALIQRVLEIQREHQMLYGTDPTAEDVARLIDGG